MKKPKGHVLQNLALVSYIGITMMVPIVAGVVAGRWLDQRFGTSPIFLFFLIISGVLIGARNVYHLVMKGVDPRIKRERK